MSHTEQIQTHWRLGDSDLHISQGEQCFDERRLANVASANETHLWTHTNNIRCVTTVTIEPPVYNSAICCDPPPSWGDSSALLRAATTVSLLQHHKSKVPTTQGGSGSSISLTTDRWMVLEVGAASELQIHHPLTGHGSRMVTDSVVPSTQCSTVIPPASTTDCKVRNLLIYYQVSAPA